MRVLTLYIAILFSFSAFSQSLESFNKRFKQVRDEQGKLVAVKDSHLMTQFLINPFIMKIIKDFKEERKRLLDSVRVNGVEGGELREQEIDAFAKALPLNEETMQMMGGKNPRNDMGKVRDAISQSLKNIKNIDIEETFSKLTKTKFIQDFQKKMQRVLFHLSLNTVAATEEPRYFYRKNVAHEGISFALKMAKDRLSSIPVLNFATYLVVRVGQLLQDQRNFSQHMLLYYLENFNETELGLTKDEADKVMSSIFESRISFMSYNESNFAVNNWMDYGWNNFYKVVRQANRSLEANEFRYTGGVEKVNFCFAKGSDEDGEKFINLTSSAHMFTSRPATTFFVNKPYKILVERRLLGLADAGLNFLPIPGWIKSLTESVLESFYKSQASTEGVMAAYFESNGDNKSAQIIYQQSMNPFILIP